MKPISLDYNASTPIAPEVANAMRPFLTGHFGNPSSPHWAGAPAKQALESARVQVAALLGCTPQEIVFTSGGTEANNHAIKGAFFALRERGNHVVTTQIEHPAMLQPCRFLERLGAEVTYLPVDGTGRVNLGDVRQAIPPHRPGQCHARKQRDWHHPAPRRDRANDPGTKGAPAYRCRAAAIPVPG